MTTRVSAPRDRLIVLDRNGRISGMLASHLSALLLIIVAGMFWYSHQRRPPMPRSQPARVLLNLLFLLGHCPAGHNGPARQLHRFRRCDRAVRLNLSLISTLNTVLWVIAATPRRDGWRSSRRHSRCDFLMGTILSVTEPYPARYAAACVHSPGIGAYVERWKTSHAGLMVPARWSFRRLVAQLQDESICR
jgi:hypothetical protein